MKTTRLPSAAASTPTSRANVLAPTPPFCLANIRISMASLLLACDASARFRAPVVGFDRRRWAAMSALAKRTASQGMKGTTRAMLKSSWT